MRNSARRRAEKTTRKTAARKARNKTCARERRDGGWCWFVCMRRITNVARAPSQCVLFHPQVPPNNIRRNFFFFFLSFIGLFARSWKDSSTLFFRQKNVRNCWEFYFSPKCKFNFFLIIIGKIGQSVLGKITKLKQEFEQAGFFFQFCDVKNLAKLVKFTPQKKIKKSHFFLPQEKKQQQQNV